MLREGGGKAGHERQHKMGPVCKCASGLRHLLDKDSPFFEIGLWAAYKMYEQWGKFRLPESWLASATSKAFHA